LFSYENNIIPRCTIINQREKTIMRFMGPHQSQPHPKEIVMNATLHRSAILYCADKPMPAEEMRLDSNGGRVRLGKGRYLRAMNAKGWTVRVLAGTVWITQDWDSRDIVLNANEQFVLDRKGAALLWPLGDTEICVARSPARCVEAAREEDEEDDAQMSAPLLA
jgi:hypothetical protein